MHGTKSAVGYKFCLLLELVCRHAQISDKLELIYKTVMTMYRLECEEAGRGKRKQSLESFLRIVFAALLL